MSEYELDLIVTGMASYAGSTSVSRLEPVLLPWNDRTFQIERPVDTDGLLDAVEGDPEQNLPYWAEIWPSGIALADLLLKHESDVRGKRALEIGCGLGVTACAALLTGLDLLAVDYFPDALVFCERNVYRNTGLTALVAKVNWRAPDESFWSLAGEPFPLLLAADVLYERRDIEPLLAFVDRLLAPDGELWLAEPGREPAALWLALVRERGWQIASTSHTGPWPDPKDAGVVVGLHRIRRGV